ncbi:hypothetical protein BGZ97_007672 [Linnemannia gamsii]|uniref:F-box domain-containing protein n=1 Tax=Linnemannia gamsii TaxID=64522 RepID=A0A9P6RAG0_9FUNG|nr:hypothetical protein BGZ97_007672 [Linnemannia gamsii]
MSYIPTEILLIIGALLNGRSLVASLQVSRDWYNALHTFVWTTISERHWVRAGFPLRTHNLVRFALVMVVHGPEDHILSSIFKLLHKLPRLEALEINLPCRNRQVPIKHHFQLLSRLKELKIAGGWYRGVEPMGPVPDNILPWKLQHLTSDRLDMFFFPYCLNLERLSFTTSGLRFGVPENTSFKQKVVEQLQQLVKLETIIFEESSYYPEFEYKIQRAEGLEKNRWALTSDTIAKTYSLDMLLNMI